MTNAFLPALGRSPRPRIVNVSSGTASLTWSTNPSPRSTPDSGSAAAYRSSKAALNALTVFCAQKLAEDGFKVNALAPGLRATDLHHRAAAGGDPAEAGQGGLRLALLLDDGPTCGFFSWDGTPVPWWTGDQPWAASEAGAPGGARCPSPTPSRSAKPGWCARGRRRLPGRRSRG